MNGDGSASNGAVRRLGLSAIVAAALFASLGLFSPLGILAGNPNEFASGFSGVVVLLPVVAVLVALAALVGALLGGAAGARYRAALAALAVLAWLQANILVWDYGPLDGRSIDWSDGAWRGGLDAAIWLTVLGAALVGYRRWHRLLVRAAAAVLAIQVVASALAIADYEPAPVLPAGGTEFADGAIAGFSAERNVLHLVLDGFQSDIFADIVNSPAHTGLRDGLTGFTFFAEHTGAYPYTQLSIPALLGGRLYTNEQPAREFVAETLARHSILAAAGRAGFEIDVAAFLPLRNVYLDAPIDRAHGIAPDAHIGARDFALADASRLADVALFRSVPHFAKALVHRDELWVFQGLARDSAWLQLQYYADLAFLDRFVANMRTDRDQPVYKLLHLMLSHRPTVGTAECGFDGMRKTTRATVTEQAVCGLRSVMDVLRRMRELGIYDDSVILLTADHGAWVPIDGFPGSAPPGPVAAGMAMPLLAVKPAGAGGQLAVSSRPTAITDVPATLAALLELDTEFPGRNVFAPDYPEAPERRHFTYAYGDNPERPGYLFPMKSWIIRGSPSDPAAWHPGPRYLPGGTVAGER